MECFDALRDCSQTLKMNFLVDYGYVVEALLGDSACQQLHRQGLISTRGFGREKA